MDQLWAVHNINKQIYQDKCKTQREINKRANLEHQYQNV